MSGGNMLGAEMITTGIINVVHECEDSFHEFLSPQIPGFYLVVEQDDLEAAFNDIPAVLSELIHADTGERVVVTQEKSYSEYLDSLPDSFKPRICNYTIKLAA